MVGTSDYLGFLTWWTSSVSCWDANLDHHVVNTIRDLQLHRFRRRGVLVDLERHWREINIPNLLQHKIPIAYPWSSALASIPCFTGLAPHVLTMYDQLRGALARDVHSSELQGLSSDFAVMRRFDHYFQELHPEGRPDSDVIFNDNWSYFMVDFQGWSRRQIQLRVACHYYLLFASSVGMEDESNVVLFHRWEPLGNLLVEQPSAMQDVEESGVVRGTGEIRDLHKYNHAPTDGSHVDLDGQPQCSACLPDGSHRDHLS